MDRTAAETLALPSGAARIEWRRSTRARRISLRIDPRGGAVVVTLPPRAARHAGVALLMDHADWVAERLAALPGATPFAAGAKIPLHGVEHRIRHVSRPESIAGDRASRRGAVWVDGREILVTGEADFLSRRVTDFLRAEARRHMTDLVQQKAGLAGVTPRSRHGEGYEEPLGKLCSQPQHRLQLAPRDGAAVCAGLRGGP